MEEVIPNIHTGTVGSTDIQALTERIAQESAFVDLLTLEMSKVIIGQKKRVERLMIGLLANGHILLEGLPGLAALLEPPVPKNSATIATIATVPITDKLNLLFISWFAIVFLHCLI